ncbi:hypothetical protein PHSC3_001654 [Chlamydiales bacterium STE3]|nr:hypothetical protein PHSC3_001654 [Chlamydiales bacterium STE3]
MALPKNLAGQFRKISKTENGRVDRVRRLGIDFSKTVPFQTSIIFEAIATLPEQLYDLCQGSTLCK